MYSESTILARNDKASHAPPAEPREPNESEWDRCSEDQQTEIAERFPVDKADDLRDLMLDFDALGKKAACEKFCALVAAHRSERAGELERDGLLPDQQEEREEPDDCDEAFEGYRA